MESCIVRIPVVSCKSKKMHINNVSLGMKKVDFVEALF